jgi:hypothetical protein
MALKLKNFDATHVAVLNQWANQQENQVQAHTTQLNNLSTFLDRLFKANPDLVKPNDK